MLNINKLCEKIRDTDDALTNVDDAHTELAHEESTGMIEMLEYLVNSELVQWSEFFIKPEVLSILDRCNKFINYENSSPSIKNIFRSYKIDPYSIKVVLIGMDPYPQKIAGIRVANGIPFDINKRLLDESGYQNSSGSGYMSKSLSNFLEELSDDLGTNVNNFDFNFIISQGVFMINYAHTVSIGTTVKSGSHMKIWKDYTEELIQYIISLNKQVVFGILGSGVSYRLRDVLFRIQDRCITTGHPSRPYQGKTPFSGSKIFSQINTMIENPIIWIKE